MDKLNPVFQPTPLTPQVAASVGGWYATETTIGVFTSTELAWHIGQGWRITFANLANPHFPTYALARRVLKPENALGELVRDYTAAYNEGRQLNDQRYDDLVVLYTAILDKTEDTFNSNASADTAHEAAIRAIISAMEVGYEEWATDVGNDLNTWGLSLVAEVNARFDAESSKASQALIDRGLYTSLLTTNASASVERERTRALTITNDQIQQRKTELKNKIYEAGFEMRNRVILAYERMRAYLSGAVERQVAVRNAAADALGRLVERREDDYPDLSEIGKLAASLGAGSAEAYAP